MSSTSIIWLVDYYQFTRAKTDECLLAQPFLLNHDEQELEFNVVLIPKPRSQYMDLKINLVSGTISRPTTIKFTFYVHNRSMCSYAIRTIVPGHNQIVWLEALKRPKREPCNPLKFGLDVIVGDSTNVQNSKEFGKTLDCYSSLLQNGNHHDVVFEVGGEEIKAHKSILSVRNNVFAAMFAHNYQETTNNRVLIEDIPADIFKKLLVYLYAAVIPEAKELTIDLLKAAHKYNILELQQICLKAIDATLNCDNAIEVLILYDMYGFERNKQQVVRFINKNSENIMTEVLWIQFAKEHPQLLIDLYIKAKKHGKRRHDEGYQSSSSSSSSSCEIFTVSKKKK